MSQDQEQWRSILEEAKVYQEMKRQKKKNKERQKKKKETRRQKILHQIITFPDSNLF